MSISLKMGLDSRAFVVVGAGGGLGRAICRYLTDQEATVVAIDRQQSALNQLTDYAKIKLVADATEPKSLAEQLNKLDLPLHGLVNCQGILHIRPALELSHEEFLQTMNVNVSSIWISSVVFAKIQVARKHHGSIVNLSSVSSQVVNPGYSAYATSKAAVSQLTRVLALEWATHNLRVNAIGPAMTPTPMTDQYLLSDDFRASATDKIPLGRLGRPNDFFGILGLLLSDQSMFITGQTIMVDGGRTLC
jgi:NAD(P)-dependent dehydrogenase (short-subunit alcohol dehydrogenase family)